VVWNEFKDVLWEWANLYFFTVDGLQKVIKKKKYNPKTFENTKILVPNILMRTD